jgi:hypothetical protein
MLNRYTNCSIIRSMLQLLFIFYTLTCSGQVVNRVAGIYGLVAVFTGASLAQLSMYLYSIALLFVCVWGIRAASAVSPCILSGQTNHFLRHANHRP